MPNHVINKITILSDNVDEVRNFLLVGEQGVDFNTIIPTPSHVFIGDSLSKSEEEFYGRENCWYDWSINNWGTKWNAYETVAHGDTIEFQTAWSGVAKLMGLLSMRTKSKIEYKFACEGGCVHGHYLFDKGEVVEIYDTSMDDIYKELWGEDEE